MTIHEVSHLKEDIDKLYRSRKEGGRRLASSQDGVNAPIQRLEDYTKKSRGKLVTATEAIQITQSSMEQK